MKSICVYCGSSFGARQSYLDAARALGAELAGRGITLVYGGGNVGLMGAIADAVMDGGGKVIGVIPQALVEKELAHSGLTELKVVNSMHERKALMADLSDAFIALPGGLGTLEEFCEIATWTQLGFLNKPSALLNIEGYWDGLLGLLDHATAEGFIRREHRATIITDNDPVSLLDRFREYQVPALRKWIEPDQR